MLAEPIALAEPASLMIGVLFFWSGTVAVVFGLPGLEIILLWSSCILNKWITSIAKALNIWWLGVLLEDSGFDHVLFDDLESVSSDVLNDRVWTAVAYVGQRLDKEPRVGLYKARV